MSGPLTGIRVLDMCHFLAGPYAATILAELGADVIKVEDPDRPDETRQVGPHFIGGQSLYFAAVNSGKRSLALRLARPEGRQVMAELIRSSDVFIENYRPGTMAKLGLAPDQLQAINPRLVTCSISGFGATGPRSEEAGYDYTIQALAGVMSLTGEPDGPPGKAGMSYVDHSAGLAAGLAVCAALIERGRTGLGRHIDLGLFDMQISMLTYLAAWQLNAGDDLGRTANGAHPSLVPAQVFRTSDGYLSVFVGNDPMWARLVGALCDPRLTDENYATGRGRLQHRDPLLAMLGDIFAGGPNARWFEVLSAAGVACAPVNTVRAALADPQVAAGGLIGEASHSDYGSYRHVRGPLPGLSGNPCARAAPRLGEDSLEVLADLGHDADEIAALIAAGTVAAHGA